MCIRDSTHTHTHTDARTHARAPIDIVTASTSATGFEVSEDQILEMTDMRFTSLGAGVGHNYTFTYVPRPPEVPPPLLPQPLYTHHHLSPPTCQVN